MYSPPLHLRTFPDELRHKLQLCVFVVFEDLHCQLN